MSSKSLTSATAVAASSRAMRLSSSSEQLMNQIEAIQSYYNSCGTKVKQPKQSKSFHEDNENRLKHTEELASKMKQKFKKAKKYVDIDLAKLTQDMNDMLKKTNDSKPELSSSMENILCIADQCTKTSADEFWFNCEGIVQELDDQRKELPNGSLKRAYTNLLFVLTRCTRLVQASKEDKIHHQEFCFLNGEYFRGR
ncbi:putative serine/threonine protein kinase IRE3 [Silene latifolia]|uniref:putative serine/threonine protein kinase IRE3 n=1 Tax=Silene latifolia TaxID=37657 RepID=UPI003D77F771